MQRITSIHFSNYKAFSFFSVSLEKFNILVGANNAGKSTILGAIRILSEALRKARNKKPTIVSGPDGKTKGYEINLSNIPVAAENIYHNYDDSKPASVTFRTSGNLTLQLYFPESGVCNLICGGQGKVPNSPTGFKDKYKISIGFVPVLGPVDHEEVLFQKDAAREALLTHKASRNFRNIWYHYSDKFDAFRELIQRTWPGMDIKKPEIDETHSKPLLRMFCPEDRIDREVFWAGFGFQVWCQMLTFVVNNQNSSLFIIDEPDIYLHSDIQRQLVSILRTMKSDILLATHSPEIIAEASINELLIVSKSARSAKRVGDPTHMKKIFDTLGSNLNPTLTQIAKTKKIVFVEGKDFRVLSQFAFILGLRSVALRSSFAVVPTQGFNPLKIKYFIDGTEKALSAKVLATAIFDRDYRTDQEVELEGQALSKTCKLVHIHTRKELENFLLVPDVLDIAVHNKLEERSHRTSSKSTYTGSSFSALNEVTEELKETIQGQFISRRQTAMKSSNKSIDDSTIIATILRDFSAVWDDFSTRLNLVPGKLVLSKLNDHLQSTYSISLTENDILSCFTPETVPTEIKTILMNLDEFSKL